MRRCWPPAHACTSARTHATKSCVHARVRAGGRCSLSLHDVVLGAGCDHAPTSPCIPCVRSGSIRAPACVRAHARTPCIHLKHTQVLRVCLCARVLRHAQALVRWGGALLELAHYKSGRESTDMIKQVRAGVCGVRLRSQCGQVGAAAAATSSSSPPSKLSLVLPPIPGHRQAAASPGNRPHPRRRRLVLGQRLHLDGESSPPAWHDAGWSSEVEITEDEESVGRSIPAPPPPLPSAPHHAGLLAR